MGGPAHPGDDEVSSSSEEEKEDEEAPSNPNLRRGSSMMILTTWREKNQSGRPNAPYTMLYGGFLYDTLGHSFTHFKPDSLLTRGWESVRAVRKVIMILVAVFVHDEEMAANLVLIGLMLGMLLCAWAKPFKQALKIYNMMEAASLLIITLTLVLSKLDTNYYSRLNINGGEVQCNSTLLIVISLNVLFFLVTISLGLRELVNKKFHTWEFAAVGKNWTRLAARIVVLDLFSGGVMLSRKQGVHEPVARSRRSRMASEMSVPSMKSPKLSAVPVLPRAQSAGPFILSSPGGESADQPGLEMSPLQPGLEVNPLAELDLESHEEEEEEEQQLKSTSRKRNPKTSVHSLEEAGGSDSDVEAHGMIAPSETKAEETSDGEQNQAAPLPSVEATETAAVSQTRGAKNWKRVSLSQHTKLKAAKFGRVSAVVLDNMDQESKDDARSAGTEMSAV